MESFCLSITQWVFTLPVCEPISRELDSFPSWLMERPFIPLMGGSLRIFIFRFNFHTVEFSSISPFSHSFFSISPHSHLMAHLLEWFLCLAEDSWWPRFYLWCFLCNIISIWSIIWNIRNTCMKGLQSPCSWITSFHGFDFNIEVALYHICMRTCWRVTTLSFFLLCLIKLISSLL